MNKNEIMKKVSGTVTKVGFKLKKHSPEIFIVAGVVGTVVGGVMACKATTKVSEILEETKDALDTIHEGVENGEIKGAVTETMINGNFAEMLNSLRDISKEVVLDGSSVIPYMAFDGIVVSGK